MIEVLKIDLRLNTRADARSLVNGGFDEIVIATGITPRTPDIPGIDHPMVASYVDVINGKAKVGKKVALIGAGGIGFDVAELVSHAGVSASMDVDVFAAEWGIDFKNHPRGGVTGVVPHVEKADRTVTLLQRKAESLGRSLGKTTGWTHKATLQKRRPTPSSSAPARTPCAPCTTSWPPSASPPPWWAARTWPRSWTPSGPSTRRAGWPLRSDFTERSGTRTRQRIVLTGAGGWV